MVDPSLLDEKGMFKFVPLEIASRVMADHKFVTHRQSHVIWVYKGKVYGDDGEEVIREQTRVLLGGEATANRVNEVVAHIRETTYMEPEKFNPPLNLINLKNGILDIKSGELKPHTPNLIFTNLLPVDYNPTAKCPKIGEFMQAILPGEGDVAAFVESIGFCLQREYFIRKVVILLGEGGNGKSTLLRLVEMFLGEDSVAHLPVQQLGQRFSAGKLYGKLANILADLPRETWKDTGFFKLLTGRDNIEADVKFKGGFKFRNYAKMFFSANKLPETTDDTKAFFDRLLTMMCSTIFEEGDPDILKKVVTDEELSGLLNAALAGLRCLQTQRDFISSKSFEETRSIFIHKSNPIKAFAEDCLDYCAEKPMQTTDDIYNGYRNYCEENGFNVVDKSVFGRKLPSCVDVTVTFITTIGGKRARAYNGIRLKARDNWEGQKFEPVKKGARATRALEHYYNCLNNLCIVNNRKQALQPVQEPEVKPEKIEEKTHKSFINSPTEPTTQDIVASVHSFSGSMIFKEKVATRAKCTMDRLKVVLEELEKRGAVRDMGALVEVF